MAAEFQNPGDGGIIDVSDLSLRDLEKLGDSAVSKALRDVLSREEQDITASWSSRI